MTDNFWQQDPKTVAKNLIGKMMICGDTRAKILEAEGYPPMMKKRGVYHAILRMKPGEVYLPEFRNSILLIIVVSGGRILIRSVEIGDVVAKGPGRVTKALGIVQKRARGTAHWVGRKAFEVRFSNLT